MEIDVTELISMNLRIGSEESRGNREYLEDILAPSFAMRRAGEGTIANREAFLSEVKESPQRVTRILAVALMGENRATVSCIVTQEGKQYDNFRLFVREFPGTSWKLLAWANEPLTAKVG